jgi:hypothetical protein
MVVDGEDLGRSPLVEEGLGPVHDEVHDASGLVMGEILVHELRSSPRVHEVVEAHALDVHFLYEVKIFETSPEIYLCVVKT